jgi:hypothetical protein
LHQRAPQRATALATENTSAQDSRSGLELGRTAHATTSAGELAAASELSTPLANGDALTGGSRRHADDGGCEETCAGASHGESSS